LNNNTILKKQLKITFTAVFTCSCSELQTKIATYEDLYMTVLHFSIISGPILCQKLESTTISQTRKCRGRFHSCKEKNIMFYERMLLRCSGLHLTRMWNALCMHNRFAIKLRTGI
jgi:hypothetical protein